MTDYDQQLLNQRGIIETVIRHLKASLPSLARTAPLNAKCNDTPCFNN